MKKRSLKTKLTQSPSTTCWWAVLSKRALFLRMYSFPYKLFFLLEKNPCFRYFQIAGWSVIHLRYFRFVINVLHEVVPSFIVSIPDKGTPRPMLCLIDRRIWDGVGWGGGGDTNCPIYTSIWSASLIATPSWVIREDIFVLFIQDVHAFFLRPVFCETRLFRNKLNLLQAGVCAKWQF